MNQVHHARMNELLLSKVDQEPNVDQVFRGLLSWCS